MARITIEDCMNRANNRFKLVILASQRAHDLSSGSCSTLEQKSDKNTVVALKEIAEGKLNVKSLFNLAVQRCKTYVTGFTNIDDMHHQKSKSDKAIDQLYQKLKDIDDFSSTDYNDTIAEDLGKDSDDYSTEEDDFNLPDDELSFSDDNIQTED